MQADKWCFGWKKKKTKQIKRAKMILCLQFLSRLECILLHLHTLWPSQQATVFFTQLETAIRSEIHVIANNIAEKKSGIMMVSSWCIPCLTVHPALHLTEKKKSTQSHCQEKTVSSLETNVYCFAQSMIISSELNNTWIEEMILISAGQSLWSERFIF